MSLERKILYLKDVTSIFFYLFVYYAHGSIGIFTKYLRHVNVHSLIFKLENVLFGR